MCGIRSFSAPAFPRPTLTPLLGCRFVLRGPKYRHHSKHGQPACNLPHAYSDGLRDDRFKLAHIVIYLITPPGLCNDPSSFNRVKNKRIGVDAIPVVMLSCCILTNDGSARARNDRSGRAE